MSIGGLLQVTGRAAAVRPAAHARRRSARRKSGRRAELRRLAATVRRRPARPWPDARFGRCSAHDRRRDAADVRLSRRGRTTSGCRLISMRAPAPTAISISSSPIGRLAPGATIDQARTEMAVESARLDARLAEVQPGNADRRCAASRHDRRQRRPAIVGAHGRGGIRPAHHVRQSRQSSARSRDHAAARDRRAARARRRRMENRAATAHREHACSPRSAASAGLAVGKGFLKLLLAAQATTNLPRAREIALDGRVLLFTLAASLLAGVIFGSAPAWQLARGSSGGALRDGARGSSGSTMDAQRARRAGVGAGDDAAHGRGARARGVSRCLQGVNPGVRADHVLTFSLAPRKRDPLLFPATLDRIRALPGVRSAAIVSVLPVSGRGVGAWYNRIDRPLPDNVQPTGEPYRVVSLDYFSTVGIALRSGRLFGDQDNRDAPAIIVNQALVKKYYPGENPLGQTSLPRSAGQPAISERANRGRRRRHARRRTRQRSDADRVHPAGGDDAVAVLLVRRAHGRQPDVGRCRRFARSCASSTQRFRCATCRRSTTSSPRQSRQRDGRRHCLARSPDSRS